MNTHEQDKADELLAAYHQAGDEEAGRPSEASRRAILEGARATARTRQPAANDSRYAWSAVAGVAVLGIAVLLWRQADTPVTVATLPPASQSDSQPSPAAVESRKSEAPAVELAKAPSEILASAERAPADKAAAAADSAPAATAAAPPVAQAAAPTTPVALKVQQNFPEAWASSTPPATVWIIEDSNGAAIRQGTLAAGESLPQLRPARLSAFAVEPESAAGNVAADAARSEAPAPDWTMQTTVNGAGVPIQIAIAREPLR